MTKGCILGTKIKYSQSKQNLNRDFKEKAKFNPKLQLKK